MLELWRAAGIDVPRNLSAEHPELHHQDTLVLEFVDGPLLSRRLVDPDTTSVRGQELIARYARELGHRHRLALDRREPGLVHEHGGVQHVLVAADRFVTIDLENAFLSRAAVAPLIHKELATALRSIARIVKPERFEELLPIFMEAYGQPELAAGAVRHYLHAPNPLRRLVWAIDRLREQRRGRRGGKYRVLRALEQHLRERGGERGGC
jgi:hypothetical protein